MRCIFSVSVLRTIKSVSDKICSASRQFYLLHFWHCSLLALIIAQFMIGEVNFLTGYADNIDMNYGKGQQAG